MSRNLQRRLEAALSRLEAVRAEILTLHLVVNGTLATRSKRCGKPGCACARDPASRHGPYHEWGRMERGKRTSESVSAEKARHLERALHNRHRLEVLLARWMRESIRVIDAKIALSAGQDRT